MTATPADSIAERRRQGIRMTQWGLFSTTGAAIAALLVAHADGTPALIGVAALVFLSSFAVGGLLGFLFAVPRVLSEGTSAATEAGASGTAGLDQSNSDAAEATTTRSRLKARMLSSNTNLERISDWLTTMLVGVGLSQLHNISAGLTEFSGFLGGFCTKSSEKVFCSSYLPVIGPLILVFGVVVGFLFLYLFTRLVIVTQLNEVERDIDGVSDLSRQRIEDVGARDATVQAAESLSSHSENPTFKAISASGETSVQESLSVMNALLYRSKGFQQVIELGNKLIGSPAAKAPSFWVYMAAAFGQKHHALVSAKAPASEISAARASALDCVRKAVAIKAGNRGWLYRLTDPNDADNDLQDFRNDPEFLAALGR